MFPILHQIVSRQEFDRIADTCHSIFQKNEVLKKSSFHQHLLQLEWAEGLRLATAQLIIQGYENGGDILRMANNIVKLKETEATVKSSTRYKEINKILQVYTMSLDDFIEQPGTTFKKLLDHIFDHIPEQLEQHKIEVSAKFEREIRENKTERLRMLQDREILGVEQKIFLREDPIFGPPLKQIELLVAAALQNSATLGTAIPEITERSSFSSEIKVPNDICC
mmetsp:Transcript_31837/g.65502  ORF Transcript_31837/g.65502 Transcript_31837/m.65502 type:complete len:223 (-) Transcript_31837:220-888(-)